MQGFIEKLCSAIATAEGFYDPRDTLPKRNNNPGDLRSAPWFAGAVIEKGYWKAPSIQAGVAGLMHQVALDIARGRTLRELIAKWAPPSDHNDTENYIRETKRRVGITDENVPLWDYLEIQLLP